MVHVGYGLRDVSGGEVRLQGYMNFEWEGSAVSRKGKLEYPFNLGSIMISWFNEKQTFVALNRAEAKYIKPSVASCEVVSSGASCRTI